MKIKLIKKANRNLLVCDRADGSIEMADLGPNFPYHDMAHYVVEKQFRLKNGFYGNIYRGYTIEELSTKDIIKTLDVESAASEIMTRALQAIGTGASNLKDFRELVSVEFSYHSIKLPYPIAETQVVAMASEYDQLVQAWNTTVDGNALELELPIEAWP